MKKLIIVSTQHGNGGDWYTECTWNVGPMNLLRAVSVAIDAIEQNSGIGGYTTIIVIDGARLSSTGYPGWPTTLDEAKECLK